MSMHRIRLAVLVLAFPICASAQWNMSGSNITSTCTTIPCKVLINSGQTVDPNFVGIDVTGGVMVRGTSPFFGLYGTAATSLAVDAPTASPASILLRSQGSESVTIRREATSNDLSFWTQNAERMRITAANGRVLIGASSPVPTAMLSVAGPDGVAQLRLTRNDTNVPGVLSAFITNSDAMSIAFSADYSSGSWIARDGGSTGTNGTAGFLVKGSGKMTFYGSSGLTSGVAISSFRDVMNLDLATGSVSIGGPVPVEHATKKLYVDGDVHFEGAVTGKNIRAQYQDLAEWVPSAEDLEPGMVVILDKRTGNTVKASTTSYDTTVAGVVSAAPGIILGEGSPSKEQVATTGRVRVRVDASHGAIEIGDLLVTSDIPGTAMKSAPVQVAGISMHRPGTIIGKALEPLNGGTGEILVLLSLQ